MNNIEERLQDVFRDVFEDDNIILTDDMTANDIEDWDSVMHMTLIIEVEGEFGVKFSTAEVIGLKNIGDFKQCIMKKVQ